MEIIGNVKVYGDDLEIVDVLKKLPVMEEFGNIGVLKFIQEKTVGSDFGTVIYYENLVYTVYKFDPILLKKEEEAGLILTVSDKENTLEQLEIWKNFREIGMSFSKKIFEAFDNFLSATHFVENYFYRKNLLK